MHLQTFLSRHLPKHPHFFSAFAAVGIEHHKAPRRQILGGVVEHGDDLLLPAQIIAEHKRAEVRNTRGEREGDHGHLSGFGFFGCGFGGAPREWTHHRDDVFLFYQLTEGLACLLWAELCVAENQLPARSAERIDARCCGRRWRGGGRVVRELALSGRVVERDAGRGGGVLRWEICCVCERQTAIVRESMCHCGRGGSQRRGIRELLRERGRDTDRNTKSLDGLLAKARDRWNPGGHGQQHPNTIGLNIELAVKAPLQGLQLLQRQRVVLTARVREQRRQQGLDFFVAALGHQGDELLTLCAFLHKRDVRKLREQPLQSRRIGEARDQGSELWQEQGGALSV